MSKLTKALEVIKNECDKHFMCGGCPLRCRDYGCRLDYWGTTEGMEPSEWPIEEVREMEHNDKKISQ